MNCLLASLLICRALAASDPQPASPKVDQGWEEVSSLARKLRQIERHAGSTQSGAQDPINKITLTQSEINSYLRLSPTIRMPSGVSEVRFRFGSGRIHLDARVDLDRIQDAFLPSSSSHPMAYLSGRIPVAISARFDSADGFGSVQLDEIWLGPATIPSSVVSRFVRSITRSSRNPDGIDLLAPFRLPYSIRKIRLKPGRAVLVF